MPEHLQEHVPLPQ